MLWWWRNDYSHPEGYEIFFDKRRSQADSNVQSGCAIYLKRSTFKFVIDLSEFCMEFKVRGLSAVIVETFDGERFLIKTIYLKLPFLHQELVELEKALIFFEKIAIKWDCKEVDLGDFNCRGINWKPHFPQPLGIHKHQAFNCTVVYTVAKEYSQHDQV